MCRDYVSQRAAERAREGRGEGTVGRRPRWVAAAAAAIVPAPRVSVGASAPGRGLGRRSRVLGRRELLLRGPGRPLPSSHPPPAARRGAGPAPCVARGSASRGFSAAATGEMLRALRTPVRAALCPGCCAGLRCGHIFFSGPDDQDIALGAPPCVAFPGLLESYNLCRQVGGPTPDPRPTTGRRRSGDGQRHPARSRASMGKGCPPAAAGAWDHCPVPNHSPARM